MAARLAAFALLFAFAAAPARAQTGYGVDVVNTDIYAAVDLLAHSTGKQIVLDSAVPRQNVTLSFSQTSAEDAIAFFARAEGLIVDRFGGAFILMRPVEAAIRAPQALVMRVVHVRYAQPSEIQAASGALTTGVAGFTVAADDKTKTIVLRGTQAQVASALQAIAAFDQPSYGSGVVSRSFRYSAGKASDAVTALRNSLHESNTENQLLANDQAGTIQAIGTHNFVQKVAELLAGYDGYGEQVFFDIRIVELTPANDVSVLGFLTNGFNNVSSSGNSTTGAYGTPLDPFALGTGYLNKTIHLFTQLDLLISNGNAKIISSPQIVAQNSLQQVLNATEQYPILTSNVSNGVSTQTVTYQPIGLQLKVTPTVGADRSVLASIDASYSTILAFVQTYPIIGQRQTTGSFRIASDETLVLSGLIQDQDSSTIEKAPILGDLPLIGAFFRHLSTNHQKTELVFIMTPHIKPAVLSGRDIPAPFTIPPKPAPAPEPTPMQLIPTAANH